MESLKTRKLELEIVRRGYDYRWKKDCVDYLRLVTIFIGKSENECRLWVDSNKQTLVKLGTPYEVA